MSSSCLAHQPTSLEVSYRALRISMRTDQKSGQDWTDSYRKTMVERCNPSRWKIFRTVSRCLLRVGYDRDVSKVIETLLSKEEDVDVVEFEITMLRFEDGTSIRYLKVLGKVKDMISYESNCRSADHWVVFKVFESVREF